MDGMLSHRDDQKEGQTASAEGQHHGECHGRTNSNADPMRSQRDALTPDDWLRQNDDSEGRKTASEDAKVSNSSRRRRRALRSLSLDPSPITPPAMTDANVRTRHISRTNSPELHTLKSRAVQASVCHCTRRPKDRTYCCVCYFTTAFIADLGTVHDIDLIRPVKGVLVPPVGPDDALEPLGMHVEGEHDDEQDPVALVHITRAGIDNLLTVDVRKS
ncbi:hypothetical protein L226DRAFT_599295 [Lentinus tigrinus ALCF2SS1-7]|uniref:Uncharacterized protein n=1 Tax=Lentinus tigrinus ALCF2SS1-6 TaxID=1328759 RepID=A0A5C2S4Z0_9APHY|nr:hypothetical protein L227DRAFT_564508 [Lentinus tigrinus ALCF2SS1-6]RPD68965.1 hypothetical protein L226DRAFT_599295 [Lentinus tigrinus ALCF2SS1-7]